MSESKIKAANGQSNLEALLTGLGRGQKLLEAARTDPTMIISEEQYGYICKQLDAEHAKRSGYYNIYVCKTCGHHIVSQDIENGVTPFIVSCKSFCKEGKSEHMTSLFYDFNQELMDRSGIKVDLKWRRPYYDEFIKLPPEYRQAILNGNLVPVTGE